MGSFTGAVDGRKGYFETVNGGTIFLDEIGEMPLGTQARLLRVLETGEFIRVGSSKVQKTDVRVIAATNRDLLDHTTQGKFREDLYYRLSTVPIRVPALRDRKEDVPLLFRKFAADFSEKYKTQSVFLDAAAQQLLVNYYWQGNVRELKNIAEQISVLSIDKSITADTLQKFLPQRNSRSLAIIPQSGNQNVTPVSHSDFNTERDILYKLFFDLKKDMNDLKLMIYDVAQHQGYTPAEPSQNNIVPVYNDNEPSLTHTNITHNNSNNTFNVGTPILLEPKDHHDDVEETLLLADREKEFITKALKKHKSRRRDAATELGISERTLYRKIKEYDIEE